MILRDWVDILPRLLDPTLMIARWLLRLNFTVTYCCAVGVLALAGSDVSAECGDYVLVQRGGQANSATRLAAHFTQSHDLAQLHWKRSPAPDAPQSPPACYGPACSSRQSAPGMPATMFVPVSPDWALPFSPYLLAGDEPRRFQVPPAIAHPSFNIKPILRPPRVA
jgi:hypothetical protein